MAKEQQTKPSVVPQDNLWAGTDTAYAAYLMQLQQYANVDPKASFFDTPDTANADTTKTVPYLLEVNGPVGVISIHGPMSNDQRWYDEFIKVASYPAIREAVVHAAEDPAIKHIMLDINSGGGTVNGVADVASLIRHVNDKVKPVTAFTDGAMMSAAYWLGSSAGKVYASKVAGVGSIGVIATHQEFSKMMEDIGIKATVIRSGKYKALANSMEPLTDAAKTQIQDSLDVIYGVFVQHVSAMRDVSYNVADSKMAQGREFWGDAALSAGLVDGITTYDELFNKISAKYVDKTQQSSHNASQQPVQGNPMKRALTAQETAILAAGGTLPEQGAKPEADPKIETKPDETKEPVNEPAEPKVETQELTPEAQTKAALEKATASSDGVVQFLQTQVREKDAALLQLNIENATLKSKVESFEATETDLRGIVAKSVNNMRVALGQSALDMSAMTSVALLAEHANYTKQFETAFVGGGVAAVDAAASQETAENTLSPKERAQLASVRFLNQANRK